LCESISIGRHTTGLWEPINEPRTSPLNRDEQIARLARDLRPRDHRGGINGAAIARDAAMPRAKRRVDRAGDFAGATSRVPPADSRRLRYLPQGELRLVRTALAERERLRRLTAPHLVKRLRFLFPLYRGRGPGRFALGADFGFDLFARTPRAERHRRSTQRARSRPNRC